MSSTLLGNRKLETKWISALCLWRQRGRRSISSSRPCRRFHRTWRRCSPAPATACSRLALSKASSQALSRAPTGVYQKLRAGAPGDFSNLVAPVIKHSPLAPADSLRREVSMGTRATVCSGAIFFAQPYALVPSSCASTSTLAFYGMCASLPVSDAAGMLMTLRPATPTTDTLDVGPLRSCCDGSEEHLLSDVSLECASRNEEDYPSAGVPREDFPADPPEPVFGDNGTDLATPIMH